MVEYIYMNDLELAWAAGLYDGEGSICVCRTGPRKYVTKKLQVDQAGDPEVLYRFLNAVEEGFVYELKVLQPSGKEHNRYVANGWKADFVMQKLVPYLSTAKRLQYLKVLGVCPLQYEVLSRAG